MTRIIVFTSLTLDGVMQAPGRPDEDRRGGFEHGGWALPYADPVLGKATGESMSNTGGLPLGRSTSRTSSALAEAEGIRSRQLSTTRRSTCLEDIEGAAAVEELDAT